MSSPAVPISLPDNNNNNNNNTIPIVIQADREVIPYNAPTHINVDTKQPAHDDEQQQNHNNNECYICLDNLHNNSNNNNNNNNHAAVAVQIITCKHIFHHDCIMKSIQHDIKCPICRKPIVCEPQGRSPTGTMNILELKNQLCPGFGISTSTIQIEYNIPNGIQLSYHDNPGHVYYGTRRIAYLPNNIDGRLLLLRFKYAWIHGLMFNIGTSLTTNNHNSVIWSSIHHKTNLHGGTHGFPDPNYITNCNASLDALNVPKYNNDITVKSETLTYTAPPTLLTRIPEALQPYNTIPVIINNDNEDEPQGFSPSGTMTIETIPDICPGFYNNCTTIQITYYIPQGIQKSYHPNPGMSYPETTRIAYLPNNIDGHEILIGIKYAWKHGLIFTIGTSLTTHHPNSVVWSGIIPHITTLHGGSGGTFSFPNPTYISTCRKKLIELKCI